MGPVDALRIALGKEEEAIESYQKFLGEFPIATDIFSFLIGEEQKHKKLIEQKIVELTK